MTPLAVEELIPLLQTAIGPVILISGIGLLLLTMTNRLGRAIDRVRSLVNRLEGSDVKTHERLRVELTILWSRAQLIRLAIILASTSALCAALLIIVIFFVALLSLEWGWLITGLFIACMATLIGSLIVFIHDVNRSLSALKLEMEE
jgi:hypothetical protein